MITSDKSNQIRITYFVGKKEKESFDAVKASVYKISQEQIAYARNITSILEKLKQIIELPMYISANGNRWINTLYITFLDQYFSCLEA